MMRKKKGKTRKKMNKTMTKKEKTKMRMAKMKIKINKGIRIKISRMVKTNKNKMNNKSQYQVLNRLVNNSHSKIY